MPWLFWLLFEMAYNFSKKISPLIINLVINLGFKRQISAKDNAPAPRTISNLKAFSPSPPPSRKVKERVWDYP
jgi:hypothetical protein